MKSLDCEIWGFHGFGIEDSSLPDCYSQRDIPPPPPPQVLIIPTFCGDSSQLLSITSQKAKSSWNWAYIITTYLLTVQTCLRFAGSDLKCLKQSFPLLKLEEPLSYGGTQRRKLWSRSFLCSRIVVSILLLCKQ